MFPSREKEESLIVCGDSEYRTRHRTERSLLVFRERLKERSVRSCAEPERRTERWVRLDCVVCSVHSSFASFVKFERNNNNKVFDPRITHFYLTVYKNRPLLFLVII